MRSIPALLCLLVAACAATPKLALLPPSGIDFSGRWHLNVADSDDPLRLSEASAAAGGLSPPGQSPRGGGRGGRGSRGGDPSQGGAPPGGGRVPALPVATVAELLSWPGTALEIRQHEGAVDFLSDGDSRPCQPAEAAVIARPAKVKGRRSAEATVCGWEGKSLLVRVPEADGEPGFDARYRITADGKRLIQVVTLNGGRMAGLSMSRVWDRVEE